MVELRRTVRTPYSEHFLMWENDKRLGSVDLHYTEVAVFGTIILEIDLPEEEIGSLIRFIDEEVIISGIKRDDFIITVLRGEEKGFYSDVVDPEDPFGEVKKSDIQKLRSELMKFTGRSERISGDLMPKIVLEYYTNLKGCTASETDITVDQGFKIDILATKKNEVHAIQVKSGGVSPQEIRKIFEKGKIYLRENYSECKYKFVEIVANRFPENYLVIRDHLLEKDKSVNLMFRHFYTLTKKLPKYKYAIR